MQISRTRVHTCTFQFKVCISLRRSYYSRIFTALYRVITLIFLIHHIFLHYALSVDASCLLGTYPTNIYIYIYIYLYIEKFYGKEKFCDNRQRLKSDQPAPQPWVNPWIATKLFVPKGEQWFWFVTNFLIWFFERLTPPFFTLWWSWREYSWRESHKGWYSSCLNYWGIFWSCVLVSTLSVVLWETYAVDTNHSTL